MKNKMKSKRFLLGLVLAIVALVGLVFFFYPRFSTKEKWVENKPNVHDIRVFGDQQQFVTFKGTAQVSQNYIVTEDYKIRSKNQYSNHFQKGDYFHVVLYDLRTPDFKERKIDLYKALQRYDSRYGLEFFNHTIVYQGRDYLGFGVTRGEGKKEESKVLLLDLETEEVKAFPKDLDYLEYAEKFDNFERNIIYTSLLDSINSHKIAIMYWSLTPQSKDLSNSNFNFAKENPQIAQLIEKGETDSIYFRKGQVTYESLFQDLRHLFAPVDQDKLEVVATYPPTGEIKVVESYQEYREWEKEVRKFEEGQEQ